MGQKPLKPADPARSQYTIEPALLKMRGADLPGMTSVSFGELLPSIPPPIFPGGQGIETVRRATRESLARIDMTKIKKGDSVNILASHHGFTLLGGAPYAELLKVTRDVIEERTGTGEIRLRAGVGLRFRETEEFIRRFGLDDYFKGNAKGMAPVDEGIPIETEFGTLYGLKRAYDAKWIIHAHNSDLRELHNHRLIDRILKPFAMSYARIETRSTYHQNFGPRSSNIIPRAVFNSDLVQSKFVFSIILTTSPNGISGVDADNDLLSQNDRITIDALRWYGKLLTLLKEIDQCIVLLDGPYPIGYMKGGGIVFDNFAGLSVDEFDLDHGWPPFSRYTEMFFDEQGQPLLKEIPPLNPAIKWMVNNYCFIGLPCTFFAQHIPTIVVGRPLTDLINSCPQNPLYMRYAVTAEGLEEAVRFAMKRAGTSNLIAFDGAVGGFNLTEPLAELLRSKAPGIEDRVETELLPKWCRQRNLRMEKEHV
ncbi:MAG: hypothetical protein ACE144_15055 [Thermodesulfobacteriota bacterium]